MGFIFWFPSFLFWLLWLLLWSVFYVVRQWHYYVLCWPVPCSAALYYIAVLYLVVCNHWMSFWHFFLICALANQLTLSCTLSPSSYMCVCVGAGACVLFTFLFFYIVVSKGSCVSEGDRSFSHLSPSDWQFNLIHKFHLQCFTSNNSDNIQSCPCAFMCLFQETCVTVRVCVRACGGFHPLVPLKLPLTAFVPPWANPLVNLLSSMFRTVCSGEWERGIGLPHSHWFSALKHNSTSVSEWWWWGAQLTKQTWVHSLLSK